jgi:hypothetical protein
MRSPPGLDGLAPPHRPASSKDRASRLQELVGLQPDIILVTGTQATACPPAGDADDPDRLCERERSRRQRHRHAIRPPEWEHHWLR